MLRIGPQQPIAARQFGAVIAVGAAVNLGTQQGGG
jgi:hypothetical protein